MTICLDLSAAAHERAGLGRYAASLARALLELGVSLTGFVNDPNEGGLPPPLNRLQVFTANLPRKRWRLRAALSYFGGPSLRKTFPGITLFHATEHLLPAIPGARTVFTLHDVAYLLYPQHHLLQNRLYLTAMMPRFLARADRVICVSENTRHDALRFYALPEDKLVVIPEGVEAHFKPIADPAQLETVRRQHRLPRRFILYVGTIEPRKNLRTLLDAFNVLRRSIPEVGLVIAGGTGWLYEGFFERLRTLGLEQAVTLTGFVPEADLPALINCAEVFAYPSLFEGFGLPPLEAMACGVPVVVSNASSLPEVIGGAGLLLPPTDVLAWVKALGGLLANPALRAELHERGLRRAAAFTWQRAAEQTLTVYRGLGVNPKSAI